MAFRAHMARLAKKVEVKRTEEESIYGNQDNRPIPPEKQTWSISDFYAVYAWMGLQMGAWTTGSSLLSLGLTVWQAAVSVILAAIICSVLLVLAGIEGVDWRISSPFGGVLLRTGSAHRKAWGVRGYAIFICIQVAGSTSWHGVQGWYGAQCLKVVIGSIIPGFLTMRDTVGGSFATNDLICVLLFWGLTAPLLWVSPHKLRKPGKIAGALCGINLIAVTCVCLGLARGAGPLVKRPADFLDVPKSLSTPQIVWQLFHGVTLYGGSFGFANVATWTRFAKTHGTAIPAQLSFILISSTVIFFGIISTSAAITIFPTEQRLLWAPFDLLEAFLTQRGGPGTRAAAFFYGLCFMLAQQSMNAAGNGYVQGQNLSSLFPRWISASRGALLVSAVALLIQPWRFAGSANTFTRFLAILSIINAAAGSIYLFDYFLVRKRLDRVSHLFMMDSRSIYWYRRGVNWRAIVSLASPFAFLLPGFIRNIEGDSSSVSKSWEYLYYLGFFVTLLGLGGLYAGLCKTWRPLGVGETDMSGKDDLSPTATVTNEKDDAESLQKRESKGGLV